MRTASVDLMELEIASGFYKTTDLPDVVQTALRDTVNVFRAGIPYTDKRNEFAAAIISATTGKIYTGGNFLSTDKAGEVLSKECAEGTALAVARATEGPEFRLGGVVILNHVKGTDQTVQGQSFGPCDRCQGSLVAATISIDDRRNTNPSFPTDDELRSVPVISGVLEEGNELGCDEVLVASLYELNAGDAICIDTRQSDTAIPLRIQHN